VPQSLARGESSKQSRIKKKDQIRNLYPNAMKTVVKKILQDDGAYDRKLTKISHKIEQEFGLLSIS